ncbi:MULTISPECIES: VWA domain-containing protein [unclassified Nitratiruptor]|uniref:VWA domain-containing protein n=1 Tax=unclassified Nitratiruptor TaxID=2624044 RepID=UPI00191552D9|nr:MULTISPECIES: VWA domain-containing protein [unclassified Nitratiruptor]BCD59890.1 Ca-activated chloride channel homolog [Nitratiruptor sp. YY08-10]BCD63813.1 Ca-activated chloride channel homolog [Nitratiruptor sp. YY08-14]
MSFEAGYWLILIIPTLLLFWIIKEKKDSIPLPKELIIEQSSNKIKLLPLVLILLFIALARPMQLTPKTSTTSLQPLFIALDMSASMRAKDLKPNRLIFAKKAIKELIQKANSKIALIVFTSNPLIIAPPTSDKAILLQALNSIDPKNIMTKSTNIQKLLNFVSKFQGNIDLVLFSDGGEEKILHKPKNIRLHFVQIATKEGALIPTNEGYLKHNGKLVVTRLNQAINQYADFIYPYDKYLDVLENIEAKITKTQTMDKIELFFIPLFIATILLLYIYTTLFEKIRSFIPFMIILAFPLHASLLDEWKLQKGYKAYYNKEYKKSLKYFQNLPYLEARYAQAMALMKLGKYKEAINILQSIKTKDIALKAKIYKNLGVCYEKIRKYDEALQYYVLAAQYKPNSDLIKKIEVLALKKRPKKLLLPFSKKKIVKKEHGKKDKGKSAGSSNLQTAALASSSRGGKKTKQKSQSITQKGSSMPLGSRLYDLINKGYIHEKHPW